MSDDTVPFGKYRGRPAADMLADSDYMDWLSSQPWFRERFKHLTRREDDALSSTPQHNRLQAMFLDPVYGWAFVEAAAPDFIGDAQAARKQDLANVPARVDERVEHLMRQAEWRRGKGQEDAALKEEKRAGDLKAVLPEILRGTAKRTVRARFEHEGADVFLNAWFTWPTLHGNTASFKQEDRSETTSFVIEIKPTVADEYPAVLRQMNRNKCDFLFLERYTGEGATEAQFIAIFRASGKRVVFKRDVDMIFERRKEGVR